LIKAPEEPPTPALEETLRKSARNLYGSAYNDCPRRRSAIELLTELEYPFHDRTITVTRCGRICMGPLKINLSQAFAGQRVGVKQVEEKIWLVSFMRYDLGFFDHETCRIESAVNPFAAKVLPMSPAPCVRVVVASRFYYQFPPVGESSRHDQAVLARL
jgi:hypothetical protein